VPVIGLAKDRSWSSSESQMRRISSIEKIISQPSDM
jgi:hypothetical protein